MTVNGQSGWLQGLVLALALASLLCSWWAGRAASPVVAILSRWVRWLFIAFFAAGLVHWLGWTGYRFPVLLAVALLAWFLVETLYNWLVISALSRSDLPLFPKFEENQRGDEWPSESRFIRLKEWLRAAGFQRRQALVSMLGEQVLMRVSVFENADRTERLHILFLPNARGYTSVCFTVFSATVSGVLIITDNVYLPFGGFYPEHWEVERRPWTRSPEKLLQRHRARIDAKSEQLQPFTESPLEEINANQRLVEQLNRELGFLHPPQAEAEHGRLTPAGKARLWQELWTLAYLGLPIS